MTTIDTAGFATQDVDELLVYTFDYDAENLPVGVTLTGAGTFVVTRFDHDPTSATYGQWLSTGTLLTKDNETLLAGSRKTSVRLSGGTVGTKYQIVNRVVTSEVPAQTKESRFFLRVTG